MKFKAFTVIEFESDCIKNARLKLKEIINNIKEDIPYISDIRLDDTKEHALFDNGDLK